MPLLELTWPSAPSSDVASTVHREGRGLVADQLLEVREGC